MYVSIATVNDIPALHILINSAYRGESSKKGWTTEADLLDGTRTDEASLKRLIEQPGGIILTSRNEAGEITGCVNLQKEPDTFYLGMLTVSPLLQAAGIGGQLLKVAEDYVQQQDGHTTSMTVISVRHELIAWYERHGYSNTGETRPFPETAAFGIAKQPLVFIVMKKDLP